MRLQWLVCSFSALLIASPGAGLRNRPLPNAWVRWPTAAFCLNSGWRLEPAGTADAARYVSDVVGIVARRPLPAGAERRLQSAVDQRARYRECERDRARSGGGRVAGIDVFARKAIASTWAAVRGHRFSSSRSARVFYSPPAPSLWFPKTREPTVISSAM